MRKIRHDVDSLSLTRCERRRMDISKSSQNLHEPNQYSLLSDGQVCQP